MIVGLIFGTSKLRNMGSDLGGAVKGFKKGLKEDVFFGEPMPPDFLMSEQIVVIGSYNNNRFIADEILLKCPSKYTEENIKI